MADLQTKVKTLEPIEFLMHLLMAKFRKVFTFATNATTVLV